MKKYQVIKGDVVTKEGSYKEREIIETDDKETIESLDKLKDVVEAIETKQEKGAK